MHYTPALPGYNQFSITASNTVIQKSFDISHAKHQTVILYSIKSIYLLIMKNRPLLFVAFLLASLGMVQAQTTPASVKDYYFRTSTNVQLEDMTNSTVLIGPTRVDDQTSDIIPMPFTFDFAHQHYSYFRVFSSGAVELTELGSTAVDDFQLFIPWGDAIGTGDNGHISYKVVGTTNRKLVVDFYMGDFVNNVAMLADKRFQVWIYESSNQIQFVYGDGILDAANATVGLIGNELTDDFIGVNTATNEVTYDVNLVNQEWPGYGRSYTFSPTAMSAVQPVPVITNLDPTNVCSGGTVRLSAGLQDGTATGYQWLKDGQPIAGATSAEYAATESGSYNAEIYYAFGTATTNSINVCAVALSADVSSTNVSCNATDNGTITIANATGGNGLYEYSIGNGWQEQNVFNGLAPGTYTIQMRTDNCVKNLGSATIESGGVSPVVTISVENNSVCSNVTLTANPADAASYVWSNGETTPSIVLNNNSADGVYTVTVSNGNNCSGTGSYEYTKQNQLKAYTNLA